MTSRAHQALDTEPPALLQASALTPGISLSGFIPLFLLPMSSAKSIKAVILLTNFSWKSNPIDTTKLEVNHTYIWGHQGRPLDSTTQGTESHSQRGLFGTLRVTWEEMYVWAKLLATQKGPGWPPSAGYTALPALQLPPAPGTVWLGSQQEMGQRHPHRLEPGALAALSHAQSSLCLQASGAERGAEGGKEQHSPDGNKTLLTRHWRKPDRGWTTASKGFLTEASQEAHSS